MASKRNQTKPDAPDWSLSEQQRTAIDLLVTGKNLQDTADVVGVQRSTVSLWVHHHPAFQAALNQRRQEFWADLVDGLRALAPKAVQVLAQALEGADPVPAAIHLLKCVGLYGGIAAPRGPTDPQVLAAAMQVAEDASQHAAADAALTIKRKAYDRYLEDMHVGPIGLS